MENNKQIADKFIVAFFQEPMKNMILNRYVNSFLKFDKDDMNYINKEDFYYQTIEKIYLHILEKGWDTEKYGITNKSFLNYTASVIKNNYLNLKNSLKYKSELNTFEINNNDNDDIEMDEIDEDDDYNSDQLNFYYLTLTKFVYRIEDRQLRLDFLDYIRTNNKKVKIERVNSNALLSKYFNNFKKYLTEEMEAKNGK